MNGRLAGVLLCGMGVTVAGLRAETLAPVDESRVSRTYYVDPSNADAVDDADHGTAESPFKTIGRGVLAAAADQDRGVGAKVILADGVYREAVRVPAGRGTMSAPLVIEAANREQAIIEGADAAGWEAGTWQQEGARWTHPWAGAPAAAPKRPATAPCRPLAGAALVFLGGQALREAADPGALAAGGFCVIPAAPGSGKGRRGREASPAALATGSIMIQPAGDEGLGGEPLEVSVQDRTFTVEGRRNVVIRGITIQHMAGAALALNGCSNALVDDVLCQWNNDAGLRITGRTAPPWSAGVTLRRVRLLYNGGSGLAATDLKDLAVEDSETSFNGFRAQWSDCIDPAGAAGCKVSGIHGGTWRRHHAIGNSARGMWWAGDCADILVEDTSCRANQISGFFFENSAGPFAVRHCLVAGTKSPASARGDAANPAAVSTCAAAAVWLEGNIVAGNEMPQLGVWDAAQRSDSVNFESGARETHRAERHRYRRNVFCGLNPEQPIFNLPTVDRGGKIPFDFFYGSLDVDENCYWNAAQPQAFCSFDKGYVRRAGVDLAGWQAFLASRAGAGKLPEGGSIWEDPLFSDAAEGDFRLGSASPVAGWGLPSDEGSPGQ